MKTKDLCMKRQWQEWKKQYWNLNKVEPDGKNTNEVISMRMRRRRSTMKKERIIMLASSVFVLTALTMTGFYVKEKNDSNKDGYMVDMSELEKTAENKTNEIAGQIQAEDEQVALFDDLDYDPSFEEASSDDVTNTWEVKKPEEETGQEKKRDEQKEEETKEPEREQEVEKEKEEEIPALPEKVIVSESSSMTENMPKEATPALSFNEKNNLEWPVAGKVLINYSMDKSIYFPTLQQYKYNPGIVIAATEGENIAAGADGKVISVYEDEEIGQTVKVDMGNGYELTYGQLKDIIVLQGDILHSGDVIGKVAEPTKYYSLEGPNVYFAVTKEGKPVNPSTMLE